MVTFNHLVQVSLQEDELKSLTMISLFETYIRICTASLTSSIIACYKATTINLCFAKSNQHHCAEGQNAWIHIALVSGRCTKRSPNLHSLMARVDQSVYIACHRWKRSFFCQVVVSSKIVHKAGRRCSIFSKLIQHLYLLKVKRERYDMIDFSVGVGQLIFLQC